MTNQKNCSKWNRSFTKWLDNMASLATKPVRGDMLKMVVIKRMQVKTRNVPPKTTQTHTHKDPKKGGSPMKWIGVFSHWTWPPFYHACLVKESMYAYQNILLLLRRIHYSNVPTDKHFVLRKIWVAVRYDMELWMAVWNQRDRLLKSVAAIFIIFCGLNYLQ